MYHPYHGRIFGIDFTSAPSPRKPITCANCILEDATLHLRACQTLADLDSFDAFLQSAGPWLTAFDFPFGLPRALIAALGWSPVWSDYMNSIASMDKPTFETMLQVYMDGQPPGKKLLSRATDVLANARSPMMLHRVPVAKMFFTGATHLFRSEVNVLPCRPTADSRIAVEGYPALVARRLIGKRSYKSDERAKQAIEQEVARREMVRGLRSIRLLDIYGLILEMADDMAESLVQDAMGDRLDAVLCAVQAGWASLMRANGYGILQDCDKDEGWIVDPLR